MTPQGASEKVDPKLKEQAHRLAKEVIDCDTAILSLLVLDKYGNVLTVERSARLSEGDYLSDDLVPKFGVLAKVIMGAAGNAADLMGRMEFLIGAFKNQKVLLVSLSEYDMALAMRVSRSSNAEYVYHKIAERLATG